MTEIAPRTISIADMTGATGAATGGQKTSFLTALGITTQLTDARALANGNYGLVTVTGGVWSFNADTIETALQSRTAAQQRADGVARKRLVRANAVTFSVGDIPVATATDGEFDKITPVPDTPATAIEIAAKANETHSLNSKNTGLWNKRSTLAMASTATIDWGGVETVPGTLDGHSLNVKLMATGTVAIQVGAIATGLDGESFLIVIQNSGGGSRTVTVQNHSSGAKVGGVSLPSLGTANGDRIILRGYIETTGSSNGLWIITSATAVAAPTYSPKWVDNGGSAYLSYAGAAFGADSVYFCAAFLARSLNTNPAASCRIIQNHGACFDVFFGSAGAINVVLRDNATQATLVNWASTGAEDGSGEWLFHIAASLTGTPSMVVTKCQLTAGVPGSWSTVTGSFTTGPTNGTIDFARAFSGNDLAIFATTAGANICDAEFAYIWVSNAAPLANTAFATGGVLFDPATVGTPVLLITGPVADLTTDKGSAGLTLTVTGTWSNT